jgi:hypothetical protein
VKIDYWPRLPRLLPPCAMQLVNPHSYTAAKAISASVLQLRNVYLGYVILYQLAHR